MRRTDLIILLYVLVLAAASLACLAPPPQGGTGEPNPEAPAAQQRAAIPTPTADTIARAQGYGLPAVQPGTGAAGPFDGPQGALLYADGDGLVTVYLPDAWSIYLAQATPQGSLRFVYGLTPQASFRFDEAQQATQLPGPNADMERWPHVNAVVTNLVQRYQLLAQNNPGGAPTPQWGAASEVSAGLHDTTMNILRGGLGDQGCTERYDGVYYLGCW